MSAEAVVVIRDSSTVPGGVDVAMLAHPEAFDQASPCHWVLRWLGENWEELVQRAALYRAKALQPGDPAPSVIHDQEKTILLPPEAA